MDAAPGEARAGTTVRHFRQILLWPLQLVPPEAKQQVQRPWEWLGAQGGDNPWTEVDTSLMESSPDHQARRYTEFVSFLPTVQRFLYGESREGDFNESPLRVFERDDLARVRVTLCEGDAPVELALARVQLHFFYDINVVILAVEAEGDDLELDTVQDLLFRFGRSYPAFWEEDGGGGNCPALVEWLSADGAVVAASDYAERDRYLAFVSRHRAAAISADWMRILAPLAPHTQATADRLGYRQLEYLRMPVLSYLALDDPLSLTRSDFARLAYATRPGPSDKLPFSPRALADFEASCCYDLYWGVDDPHSTNTRFIVTGNTFTVVGEANRPFFTGTGRGVHGQFRQEYFLLALIAHFHKAALLMFRDRLEHAVSRLDIRDAESIKRFKREIRIIFEVFLRFTHRYWFHEVSRQAPARPLFAMWRRHLGTGEMYDEIRREVQDMAQYLDSDGLRRQANTVVRLTVVTTAGLIATVATGFLGMNLIAAADEPLPARIVYFFAVVVLSAAVTVYTIAKSKKLSAFLDVLSDDRLSTPAKWREFRRTVLS